MTSAHLPPLRPVAAAAFPGGSARRLPGVTLRSAGEVQFDVAAGAVSPRGCLTFPNFFAQAGEVFAALDAPLPEGVEATDRWPVAIDLQGLWTDPRWAVFLKIQFGGSLETDLLRALRDGTAPWDLACPAMEGPSTVLGRVLDFYGRESGATPESVLYPASSPEVRRFPSHAWFPAATPEALQAFSDRGRTLLDLACLNQQWPLAQRAWRAGVRWSEPVLAKGTILQALVLRWRHVSGRTGGEARHGAEIQTWLERYAGTGVRRYGMTLAWAHEECRLRRARSHRGFDEFDGHVGFRDSPATFFARSLLRLGDPSDYMAGPPDAPRLAEAPAPRRRLVQAWLAFWHGQGVDIAALKIPDENFVETPFEELCLYESDVAWIRRQQLETALEPALPRPGARRRF